jgi:hypothetical protein
MLAWEKFGLVWGPSGPSFVGCTSALQPTPILIGDDVIRVFCGVRDKDGVSRIFFVDLSVKNPKIILRISDGPVLDIGQPGCFDENGVVPCALIRVGSKLRMYFAGYMLPSKVRFIAFSGMAESDNNGESFRRTSLVPVIERSNEEPLFRAIHSIMYDEGKFKVWYGAGDRFLPGKDKSLPSYNIRYLESVDGVNFPVRGGIAVDVLGSEYRVGRPSVQKISDSLYLMFYGYGSEEHSYKLGLAKSKDGLKWDRIDSEIGLNLSDEGWDSQMMAYPSVIETKSGTYLFYNGNEYGRSGFGVARLTNRYNL